MISEIYAAKLNDVGNQVKNISNLSKINLFVGQNNVGKSRFLRRIFSDKNMQFIPSNLDIVSVDNLLTKFYSGISSEMAERGITSYNEVLQIARRYRGLKFLTKEFEANNDIYTDFTKVTNTPSSSSQANLNKGANKLLADKIISKYYDDYFEEIRKLLPLEYSYSYETIYIPTVRGLKPPVKNNFEDVYKERVYVDYFNEEEETIKDSIFTGLAIYKTITKSLLSSANGRSNVQRFESFLQENFFQERKITLIPNSDDDVLYVKIGDEEDTAIYDLGDGIQSIIILTYPLFFTEGNLLVFIEEPELYLHPGMQRKLLECFSTNENFRNCQFILSTHSNHLLDFTLDSNQVSIYSVKKHDKNTRIELLDFGDTDIMTELGVKNSSVYLVNCTIWVEGISDRMYIRKYLSLYLEHLNEQNEIVEDIHFAFVEYAGSNITHWSFLDSESDINPNINVDTLCSKLFLITDSDGEKGKNSKKSKRFVQLEKKLGERYYCLESREIENLIHHEVLKKTFISYEGKNGGNLNFNSNFTWDNYQDKKLGTFINENVKNLKRTYFSEKDNIFLKKDFASVVVANTITYNDLSNESKALIEKIYKFICECNN